MCLYIFMLCCVGFNTIASEFSQLPPEVQGEIFNYLDPHDISAWMLSNKRLNQVGRNAMLQYIQKQLKAKNINLNIDKNINAADNDGRTALMIAVRDKDLHHVVPLLVRCGADVMHQDNMGNTVLIYLIDCCELINSAIMTSCHLKLGELGGRSTEEVKSFWASLYKSEVLHEIIQKFGDKQIKVQVKTLLFGTKNLHKFPIISFIIKELGFKLEDYLALAQLIVKKNERILELRDNYKLLPKDAIEYPFLGSDIFKDIFDQKKFDARKEWIERLGKYKNL